MRRTFILLFLALAFLALAFAQEENQFNTPETNARIAELSRITGIGGLTGWANMGKGIRSSAVKGYPPSEFFENPSEYQSLVKWMVPVLVLLGLCFVFAVLTCCICPCFYCCRSCGACGGSKPSRQGYTQNQRICAIVTMAIGLTLVTVGFIIGLVSNSVLDKGIDNTQFSIQESLADVADLPNRIQGTVENVLVDVEGAVDDVFELIEAVPDSLLGANGTLFVLVNNSTRILKDLQVIFEDLLGLGEDMTGTIQNILDLYETMGNEAEAINANVTALTVDATFETGTYRLDSTCLEGVRDIIVVNVTGVFPDFDTLLDDIKNVNLTETADLIQTSFDNINSNISALLDEQFKGAREQVDDFLNSTQITVDDFTNGTLNSILGSVNSIQDTFSQIIDEYVAPNNRWRYIIMAVLFSLNIFAIIICLIGFFTKTSGVMTCSAVFSFILIVLFWIICGLHLIIATPSGKICDIFYNREILEAIPEGLLGGFSKRSVVTRNFSFNSSSPIFQDQSIEFYVNLFYDGLDHCHDGGNLIEFLNLTDLVDFRPMVDEFINSTDLNGMVESFNFTEAVGDVDFTAGLNLTSVSDYLIYLREDFEIYINLLVNLAFNPIQSALNNATQVIEPLKDDDAAIKACLITDSLDAGQIDAVAVLVSEQLNVIHDALLSLNSTLNINTAGNITLLRTQIDAFSARANDTEGEVLKAVDFVEGIKGELTRIGNEFTNKVVNTTIPESLDILRDLADEITREVIGLSNCSFIADDLLGITNSICISAVGGLDAVWVTCGFIAIMLLVSIVGITLVAKRWIRADALDQEYGEDYYQNDEFELPPMYSDASKEKA